MTEVIHFGILAEINRLLKDRGTGYSLHAIGGCSCCGVELRAKESTISTEEVTVIINSYLQDKWIQVEQSEENQYILNVKSQFR